VVLAGSGINISAMPLISIAIVLGEACADRIVEDTRPGAERLKGFGGLAGRWRTSSYLNSTFNTL
jgi:hypothetical protein